MDRYYLLLFLRIVYISYTIFSELPLVPPMCEGLPPTSWWDGDADKSLLVGTMKHGFERYNMMRLDPALCFLTKCGPPDNAAVQVRIQKTETCSWVRFGESDNPFCKGKVRTELVFCEIVGHNNLSPPLHYTATSQGLRPLGYTVQTPEFLFLTIRYF